MASDINYASWPRHVARHIDVGDQKQLFLDDGFLVERAEGIRYVMHQPVKHSHNPLLVPDMPWELQVQLYGSVLWNETGMEWDVRLKKKAALVWQHCAWMDSSR